MAQVMPLPLTVSCFSKIQIGFTFLVLAHLDSPGKGPLNVCVCVCVCVCACVRACVVLVCVILPVFLGKRLVRKKVLRYCQYVCTHSSIISNKSRLTTLVVQAQQTFVCVCVSGQLNFELDYL